MKITDLLYIGVFIFMFVNIMTVEFYFESKSTVHPLGVSSENEKQQPAFIPPNINPPLTTNGLSFNDSTISEYSNIHGLSLVDDTSGSSKNLRGGLDIADTNDRKVAKVSPPKLSPKRPIYFLHIYKSGGTSFCSTAHSSNKIVPQSYNCNLPREISSMSADQQLKILQKYQVAANEYGGLPSSDSMLAPTTSISYIVMLRDPLNRFMSHFGAAQVFSKNKQGAFKNVGELHVPPPRKHCLFHNCDFASFLHWLDVKLNELDTGNNAPNKVPRIKPTTLSLPWTYGDFMLRYFVGFDTCGPGACTESDLIRAKNRLETLFDLVLILEELNVGSKSKLEGVIGGWDLMRAKYGWPSRDQVKRSGTHQGSNARQTLKKDPKALEVLTRAVGERDISLYQFAVELSHRRMLERDWY